MANRMRAFIVNLTDDDRALLERMSYSRGLSLAAATRRAIRAEAERMEAAGTLRKLPTTEDQKMVAK